MIDLTGTATIVTGATSGIGLTTAALLLEKGSDLVVNARKHSDSVEELVRLAASHGRRSVFVAGDIADADVATAVVEASQATFGRLDGIVHAAGGPAPGTVPELTTQAWMDAFSVHVHSTFHLFKAAHGSLALRGGSMVLLSSVAGMRGCPGTVAYQVVKAALIQMARALARDHAAEGIRINCVAPGIIDTPFHTSMTDAARHNNITNRIPMRREGTTEEVATMIVQLLQNGFITGETIVIDGGMSMRMV